jgi:hypothetical protein
MARELRTDESDLRLLVKAVKQGAETLTELGFQTGHGRDKLRRLVALAVSKKLLLPTCKPRGGKIVEHRFKLGPAAL